MSTDTSPSESVAITSEPMADLPGEPQPPRPEPNPDDGATTAGGPTMVLLFLSLYITFRVWRHRRRRATQH